MFTDDEKKLNALNLATQFQISVNWLQKCQMAHSADLQSYEAENENQLVFNTSVLIAYSYMCLVLPNESQLFKNIDSSDNLKELCGHIRFINYTYKDNKNVKSIIRHMRNAISHGNINCKETEILFYDENIKNRSEKTEFILGYSKFGTLINEIYFMQKDKHFKKSS